MALIHYQYLPTGSLGFASAKATVAVFPNADGGDVVRLDIDQPQSPWKIGQHFYLCFSALSVWQSHPFTPLNMPVQDGRGCVKQSYIVRGKKGLTRKLSALPLDKATPAIMQGPYGENLIEHLTPDVNVLAVAGGTGISYVLPVLLWLASRAPSLDRKVVLIWAVRHATDTEWITPELEVLMKCAGSHGIEIYVHATRDDSEKNTVTVDVKAVCCSSSDESISSDRGHLQALKHRSGRPDLAKEVAEFVEGTARGRTEIFASGPGSLISELRSTVATLNRPGEVFKGQGKFDVSLRCDDRLEW